ncbi:MAG: flagellar protein FliT [Butyrivibrio sp.]|nr:flagellar protein FliT [Butyrivibrio sp.]
MVSTCLDMLEDSLVKKIEVMKKIVEENEKQKEILNDPEEVNLNAFDKTLDEKGVLVDELLKLDDGFQSLFDRVKAEVGQNKENYKDQIGRMQELIKEISGMSASIEAAEYRNKKLAENYFSAERKRMNQSKQVSAAAFNYYKTMSNFQNIPPQFLDNKN